jgi:glyoxalase family protein
MSAYHLFYADGEARPGTDLTFFDWPVERERRGGNSIVRTSLRISDAATMAFWEARLDEVGVRREAPAELDGRLQMAFEDPEGQRLSLIVDGGTDRAAPWARSPVEAARQIRGLGPIVISVPRLEPTDRFLTVVLEMRPVRTYAAPDAPSITVHVYEMGEGGPAAELHVRVDPAQRPGQPGAGGVHHVAFRVRDDEYRYWVERYNELGVRSSGPVDRFYFQSLYAREPGGILCELATDGPGFATDEPMETLGESLSLPPFLESKRAAIERGLKPL